MYEASKECIWRKYLEVPSYMALFEGMTNESVIDLACGTGFYPRKIKQLTTGPVYGVDISKDMISLAKAQQTENDGITYILHDCSVPLELDIKFDIVCMTYLLQYARDYGMILDFFQTAKSLLKEGGKLIVMNARMCYGEE